MLNLIKYQGLLYGCQAVHEDETVLVLVRGRSTLLASLPPSTLTLELRREGELVAELNYKPGKVNLSQAVDQIVRSV